MSIIIPIADDGGAFWTPPDPLLGGEVEPTWAGTGDGTGTCTAPATMSGVVRVPLTLDWSAIPETRAVTALRLHWTGTKVEAHDHSELCLGVMFDPTEPPDVSPRGGSVDGFSSGGVVVGGSGGFRPTGADAPFTIWPQVATYAPPDPLVRPTLALDWVAWSANPGSGPLVETTAATITSLFLEVDADGLSPSGGPMAGGTTVTVSWSAIAADATLKVDGVTVTLSAEHTFVTPAHGAGTAHVVLTNPDASTIDFPFVYFHPPILLPSTGPIAGNTLVTLQRIKADGEGDETAFVTGATITVAGTAATDVTFVDTERYTCKTPAHAQGFADVVIVNLDARAITMTLTDAYYYGSGAIAAPTVKVSPPQTAQPPLPATVTITAAIAGGSVLPTHLWTQTGGPEHATIASPSSLTTDVTFTVYTPGVYTFTFTASDPTGAHPPIRVSTTVTLPPQAPPHLSLT